MYIVKLEMSGEIYPNIEFKLPLPSIINARVGL